MQEALQDMNVRQPDVCGQDGEQALAFLQPYGAVCRGTAPGLDLVGLNLPKKDGCEVLVEIKADATLRASRWSSDEPHRNEADIFGRTTCMQLLYHQAVDLEQFYT